MCASPVLSFASGGIPISFLSFTFNTTTNIISITLPNANAGVKGVYQVDAVFSAPGVFTFPVGLSLTVVDSCNSSTFPSPPTITPSVAYYYVGASTG